MRQQTICAVLAASSILLASCKAEPTSAEYLSNAHNYLENRQFVAGTIETRNAVKSDPDNTDARLLLAQLELRVGNAESAEKELHRARELGAKEIQLLAPLSTAYLYQSKFKELSAISSATLSPIDAALVVANQAQAKLILGEAKTAQELVNSALTKNTESHQAHLVQARIHIHNESPDLAMAAVNRSISIEETYSEAHLFRGDLHQRMKDLETAIGDYSKAIEHAGNKLEPLLKRGQVYVDLDRFEEAENDLAALGATRLPWINFTKAKIHFKNKRYQEAQIEHEEALKIAENFIPSVSSLAIIHLLQGNLGQAEQYGKQLVNESNDLVQARTLLGAIQLEANRFKQAEITLAPLLELGKLNSLSTALLVAAQIKLEKYSESADLIIGMYQGMSNEPIEGTSIAELKNLKHIFLATNRVDGEQGDAITEPFFNETEKNIVTTMEHIGRGEIPEALVKADLLRENLPENALPWNLIGRAHLISGDPILAGKAFEKAVELDQGNATLQTMLAMSNASSGDVQGARDRLIKLLDNSDNSELGLLNMARIESFAGDKEASHRALTLAVEENPDSLNANLLLAQSLISQQKFKEAISVLKQLKPAQYERVDVQMLVADAAMLSSDFTTALEAFESLLSNGQDSANLRHSRARAKSNAGDTQGALADLEKAIALDPLHVPTLISLTNLDILTGQIVRAEQRLKQLTELGAGDNMLADSYQRLAVAREKKSDGEEPSIQRFESSEELLSTARKLWIDGKYQNALELMQSWLITNPDDTAVLLTLANAHGSTGNTEAALALYKTALKQDQESVLILNNLAWYARETEPENAIKYANQALKIEPKNASVLDTLAMIHFDNGNLAEAKATFDKIIDNGGTNKNAVLYHGAQIEAALGNVSDAKAMLKIVLDSSQPFPELEEAKILYDSL